ncbi:MAG: hypothetical protein WBA93_03065 [Microcoleaceae cyanobacterium]
MAAIEDRGAKSYHVWLNTYTLEEVRQKASPLPPFERGEAEAVRPRVGDRGLLEAPPAG